MQGTSGLDCGNECNQVIFNSVWSDIECWKGDVIAYQIRQSFKPGEITPEEANEVGYETGMRFTKGKHAFIVATHVDRAYIHNHMEWMQSC